MEQEVEDIKKLEAVLKQERSRNPQEDFDDYLNYNISDDDEHLEGYDSDSSLDLDVISEDKLHLAENKYLDIIGTTNFSENIKTVKHFLSAEEIRVINSCKDSKLKQLLLLNRTKNTHLRGVLYKLYTSLKEVRIQMSKVNAEAKGKGGRKRNALRKVGYPYFKSKGRFCCSPNEDAIRKTANGEICLDYISKRRRWTIEDQVLLKRSICFQYTQSRIQVVEKKVVELIKIRNDVDEDDQQSRYDEEINNCQTELANLKDNKILHVPPLTTGFEIDWSIVSHDDLKRRHTSQACKAMWNMFLHPSINKSKWTGPENIKLKKLAEDYNYQNWEQIAIELGTNRTAFTVCIHYQSTLANFCNRGKFEPEEDDQLLRAVEKCRVGNYIPWSKVVQYCPGRDRDQLYNRYTSNLVVSCQKKGAFSEDEDILLLILIRRFGLNFTVMCNYIPHRNRLQISHRYNDYLNNEGIKQGGWTIAEDNKIMEHVAKCGPKNWSQLHNDILKRNASHVRHRHVFLKNWLSKHHGKGIEDIPRRPERKPKHNLDFITKMADKFDTSTAIPSLHEIQQKIKERGHKKGRKSSAVYVSNVVDDELLEYFQTSLKLRTAKQVTPSQISSICSTVKSILAIMKVVLVVPDKNYITQNPSLDYLDKEILSHLFGNVYSQYPSNSSGKDIKIEFRINDDISLVPPNVNTLIGMRSMLLKYNGFKSKLMKELNASSFSEAKAVIDTSLKLKVDEYQGSIHKAITMQHEDFNLRLKTLFKWPAIMSLVQPKHDLIVFSKHLSKSSEPKKVGRPRKNNPKIDLMNKRRSLKRNNTSIMTSHRIGNVENDCVEKDTSVSVHGKKSKLDVPNLEKKSTSKGIVSVETAIEIHYDPQEIIGECKDRRKKIKLETPLKKSDEFLEVKLTNENDGVKEDLNVYSKYLPQPLSKQVEHPQKNNDKIDFMNKRQITKRNDASTSPDTSQTVVNNEVHEIVDECENSRKKIKLEECVNEQVSLYNDIKKLDKVLESEMRQVDDIY